MAQRVLVPVTIASGASLSPEVNVNDMTIVGVEMPAAWDAAALTFAALTADGSTFGVVRDDTGTEVTVASVAASAYVAIPAATAAKLVGLGRVKVRSGTSGVPVNQTGNRSFFLVCVQYA